MATIYKYTNRVNGKVYVGKTSRPLKERYREHKYRAKSGRNIHWANAVLKWGLDTFDFEVLCEVLETESALVEMIFISALHASDADFGYNSTDGGEGVEGHRHTDYAKSFISKHNRRLGLFSRQPRFGKMPPEAIAKRQLARYGEGYVPKYARRRNATNH